MGCCRSRFRRADRPHVARIDAREEGGTRGRGGRRRPQRHEVGKEPGKCRSIATRSRFFGASRPPKRPRNLWPSPEEYFDQGFVFSDKHGRPFKLDAPTKAFREIADVAELPPEVSLHSLRHSFASWSIASGGDIVAVQRCLGHSVPSTTLNLYSHVVAGGREKAVAAASDTLRRAQATRAAGGK